MTRSSCSRVSLELPLNRWTEAAIQDSVEQFILDNGCPPLRTDFKKKCLPLHSVVKRRFGVTLQEWLDHNYPTEKTPLDELHAEDYNARRMHPSRGWYTIARTSRLNAMSVYAEKTGTG